MKKGVIFDLDGTLWDSAEAVADSWNEALEKFTDTKYRTSKEQMYGFMGHTMEEIAFAFFQGEEKENVLRLLEICETYENQYIAEHGGQLYEGVRETLQKLKEEGWFLAIVSNCQKGYIEAFMQYYHLNDLIDDTENFGNTGLGKDKNIALTVQRNHLDYAVYVGDIQGDCDSSEKAGVPFIHARYGFGTIDHEVPFIDRMTELPQLLRRMEELS